MDNVMTKGFVELSAIEKEEINGGLSPSIIISYPLIMFITEKCKVVAATVAVCVAKAKK